MTEAESGIDAVEAMAVNRVNWDARVPIHIGPGGYDIEALAADPHALSDVVRFDVDRLGDLTGLSGVHLQCHIGTDTVSLARLGATMTGLDFSPESITAAQVIAERCGHDIRFVLANVHDAVDALGTTYDLVYTGVGALNWLPDVARWAVVVSRLLRPGGRLHLFEHHPVLGTLDDDATPDDLRMSLPYFERPQPTEWINETSYTGSGVVASPRTYEWSHGLGETVQAVLDAGLILTRLEEHRVLPWPYLPWFEPLDGFEGWTRLPAGLRDIVPLSFTLQARKPA